MTSRSQRLAELLAARERLDARIAVLDPSRSVRVVPRVVEVEVTVRRPVLRVMEPLSPLGEQARAMVWGGATHGEVAEALGVPPTLVARLIAPVGAVVPA